MYTLLYLNISGFAGDLEGIIDEGTYKTSIRNMHKLGWKANYINSTDVSMLGHGCGVSQYPQFYDTNNKKYQMLPRPYVGSYSGQKGHKMLQQPWIIALAKSVKTFIIVSINEMPTIKYLQNLGSTIDKAK